MGSINKGLRGEIITLLAEGNNTETVEMITGVHEATIQLIKKNSKNKIEGRCMNKTFPPTLLVDWDKTRLMILGGRRC